MKSVYCSIILRYLTATIETDKSVCMAKMLSKYDLQNYF